MSSGGLGGRDVVLGAALGASGVLVTYGVYKYVKNRLQSESQHSSISDDVGDLSFNDITQDMSMIRTEAQSSRETGSTLNLLYDIAESQARKDGFMHRGITCNFCSQSPLCGVRYKCSSCLDYDICERCEPKDNHNKTHAFLRIKVPLPPLANPRKSLVKALYPGKRLHLGHLGQDELEKYKNETYFDQYEVEAIFEQYKSLSTGEEGITRDVFDVCLGPLAEQKNLIVDRLFKYYDKNNNKYIDFPEMITGLSVLVKGNQQEKLPYAFEGYDLENKGYITKDNLRRMFRAYFDITVELVKDVVKSCEEEMMTNFDDSSGRPISALFSAPLPPDSTNNNNLGKGDIPANPGRGKEAMWPVMESMSQDAINEMVDNIFKVAKLKDGQRMTFDKFKVLCVVDASLVAWFDALGTVF